MGKRAKFKFVVDTGDRRSAVWTVSIQKNDIYITSSMSKQDKVSLHESGLNQWSMQSEKVSTAPFVPSTGRHFARWRSPEATAGRPVKIFFVLVMRSELRGGRPEPEKDVLRLSPPSIGEAVQVNFFMLRDASGSANIQVEPSPLFVHQLADGRYLILIAQTRKLGSGTMDGLSSVRSFARQERQKAGAGVGVTGMARLQSPDGIWGLSELAAAVQDEGEAGPK